MSKYFSRLLFRSAIVLGVSFVLAFGGVKHLMMQTTQNVVILVVDDFTGETPDVSDYDANDSCAVSFEEQAFAVRGAATGTVEEATHGDLVFAQLEEMLEDAGVDSAISLVPIDMHGLTAESLVNEILDTMNANPANVYVVNMSFALIPCDYVVAYTELQSDLIEAREAQDLNQYRSLLRRAVVFYDDTVFPAMSQHAQQMVNLNPLQDLFVEQGALIIPVAAAGNYGLNFPFWPGAWAQVVSVSASTGEGYYPGSEWTRSDDSPLLGAEAGQRGRNARISNYGEVMLPGEYNSEVGLISGTSFAAPRLTVILAIYALDVGQGYCQDDDGNLTLAYGDWDNMTLNRVAQEYCAAMLDYLPD